MAARFGVSHDTLDPARIAAALEPLTHVGAVVTFAGVVRASNQGRVVTRLDYEGYESMVVRVFERIANEIDEAWPGTTAALHHRLGTLAINDVSVVIVTASAHRAAAYAANRYAIERVKQIAPVWKHEYFEGGEIWIEGAIAGVDDATARQRAMETACG